jgi:putative phosphoesterase
MNMATKEQHEDYTGGVTVLDAERIGLIADSHSSEEDGSDLPDELFQALDGVDAIVHLGHTGVRENLARGSLDRLAKLAPLLAVRDFVTASDGNTVLTPADGDRIKGVTRVFEVGGVRIGVIHNLEKQPGVAIPTPPGGLPDLDATMLPDILPGKFGGPVDVVAFASTHRPVAMTAAGVLFVNPGSPTYPKGPGRLAGQVSLGTVAVLTVQSGVVSFELCELGARTAG